MCVRYGFRERLNDLSEEKDVGGRALNPHAGELSSVVDKVVDAASDLATRVWIDMKEYTDHGKKHFENVLKYMEDLAGAGLGNTEQNQITKMGALECGLAILSAYTHDLGMLVTSEERETLNTADTELNQAWLTFLHSHSTYKKAVARGESIEELSKVLGVEYLRKTHADDTLTNGYSRMENNIQAVFDSTEAKSKYGSFDLGKLLVCLGISHGQSIDWIKAELLKLPGGLQYSESNLRSLTVLQDEKLDLVFLSWLLRVADVMDLDSSRTPRVIYDLIGIENPISQIEWEKHLAIEVNPDLSGLNQGEPAIYKCAVCPSPQVEKALRMTIGCINREFEKVKEAQQDMTSDRLALSLPEKAECEIVKKEGGYFYQDVEFSLNKESVIELLMGDKLYEKASLALRELVQNSLDALHMRDLRSQLQMKVGKSKMRTPLTEFINSDELKVEICWGTVTDGNHAGKSFITVKDNGVGMTLGMMEQFLTKVGRSFYKSESYQCESEVMRQNELLCTTISQFGIGFLSSFMLADHITVKSRSSFDNDFPNANDTDEQARKRCFPVRAEISGAHEMLAFYPDRDGEIEEVGTEVTLYLKEGKELTPSFDPEKVSTALKKHFYDVGKVLKDTGELDPCKEIGMHFVSPRYPLVFKQADTSLTIDEDYHRLTLLSIDVEQVKEKALEWGVDALKDQGEIHFQAIDWIDDDPEVGTGSRIKLLFPRLGASQPALSPEKFQDQIPEEALPGFTQAELQQFTETAISHKGRRLVLLNGIRVDELGSIWYALSLRVGSGGIIWLDLKGDCVPRLRADRSGITESQEDILYQNIHALEERFHHVWVTKSFAAWRAFTLAFGWEGSCEIEPKSEPEGSLPEPTLFLCSSLLQEGATYMSDCLDVRYYIAGHDEDLLLARDKKTARLVLDHAYSAPLKPDYFNCVNIRTLNKAHAMSILDDVQKLSAESFSEKLPNHLSDSMGTYFMDKQVIDFKSDERFFNEMILGNIANYGLHPSHKDASPIWKFSSSQEPIFLSGPCKWIAESYNSPADLRHYDLCFPYSSIPLNQFRNNCPTWNEGIELRSFIVDVISRGVYLGVEKENDILEAVSRLLNQKTIFLLIPGRELYFKDFDQFSQDDKDHLCVSVLWDLEENELYYVDGVGSIENAKQKGQSLADWRQKSQIFNG